MANRTCKAGARLPAEAIDLGDQRFEWRAAPGGGGRPMPTIFDPLSGETRANTEIDDTQFGSSIAALDDGGFVVVWTSIGQDGSDYGIYAQRYDAEGDPVGAEFLVNTETDTRQDSASVAAIDGGGFIVAWESFLQDGGDYGVYAQRYAADGDPLGGEFRVNTTVSNAQYRPTIAPIDGGGFVIAWGANFQDDPSSAGIYAQRYNANGAKIGNEFRVNTFTAGDQINVSASGLQGGGFVMVWESATQDGSGAGVYAQRYSANGSPAGLEFRVNATTLGNQAQCAVAGLDGGGFVVTWNSFGQDGDGAGIYAQRYTAGGAPVGGEFRVNTTTAGNQARPSVEMLDGGGFIVSWVLNDAMGFGIGVYAQAFDANGVKIGDDEFLVNQTAAGNRAQKSFAAHSVDMLGDGSVVITWDGQGIGDGDGVFWRRFSVGGEIFEGTNGPNSLIGDVGDDSLIGLAGNDTLRGDKGGDLLDGGQGVDAASYAASTKAVVADLKVASQNTNEAAGDSYIDVEQLIGSAFNDTLLGDNKANGLFGLSGNDSLDGRIGNDNLDGAKGNDYLNGSEGNDTLRGAGGQDTLRGGNGADRYILDSAHTLDRDTILDFNASADEIALSGAAFGLTPGALNADAFTIGAFAADAEDRFIFKPGDGKLFFDPDGTGAQAQVLIATLSNTPTLGAGEFVVI